MVGVAARTGLTAGTGLNGLVGLGGLAGVAGLMELIGFTCPGAEAADAGCCAVRLGEDG